MDSKALNAGAASFMPEAPKVEAQTITEPPRTSLASAAAAAAAAAAPAPSDEMEDSFLEFQEMVESIEELMDNQGPVAGPEQHDDWLQEEEQQQQSVNVAVDTGLPAHLASKAAEFWFPESRSCTCCNGFKYGCSCAATNPGGCTSCGRGGAPTPAPVASSTPPPTSSTTGSFSFSKAADATARFANPKGPPATGWGGTSGGRGRGRGGGGTILCKFFLSPRGCRNGASCTFLHPNQG